MRPNDAKPDPGRQPATPDPSLERATERDRLLRSILARFDADLASLRDPDTPRWVRRVLSRRGKLRKPPVAGPSF